MENLTIYLTDNTKYPIHTLHVSEFNSMEEAYAEAYRLAQEYSDTDNGLVFLGGSYDDVDELPIREVFYYRKDVTLVTLEDLHLEDWDYSEVIYNHSVEWTKTYDFENDPILDRMSLYVVDDLEPLKRMLQHHIAVP